MQEHVIDPNIIVTSLIGQALEIGWAEATGMVIAIEKGADLIAFGLSTYRQPYKLISGPSIKTLADLKGRKIGISSEIDVYTYVLRQLLISAKLDPDKDVEWIVGGNSTRRLAAIVGGGMDAGLFSPPADSRLQREGYNVLAFTPDLYPSLTLSATAARRDWAEKNGETLKRYLLAQANAAKWLLDRSNKDRAIKILADVSGSSIPDAEEAYAYYIGTDVWTHACINRPGLESVVRILRITKQVSRLTEADVAKFAVQDWCAVK